MSNYGSALGRNVRSVVIYRYFYVGYNMYSKRSLHFRYVSCVCVLYSNTATHRCRTAVPFWGQTT